MSNKRKHEADPQEDDEEIQMLFSDMGLDGRLLKAISTLGWKEPTLIQEKAIPLALDGKDILGRGRTGSGKTGAYLIPILQRLLELKKNRPNDDQVIRSLILAPSKELTHQIAKHATDLLLYASNRIKVVDMSPGHSDLKMVLAERPDILVATPSKLLACLKAKTIGNLKGTLTHLVLDEADLMFSFGYEADLKNVLDQVLPPLGCQSFLMSATLNPEVLNLKKLCLKNPVTLKLEEPDIVESERLIQYHIQCEEEEKYVLLNALFKLSLIRGRTIVFVNSVDKCYKIKLFLEQFGVKTCILNPELPVASRCHVVDMFNRGSYDTIIASDEKCAEDPNTRKKGSSSSSSKNRSKDSEFDTATSYVHRVGRTGRGAFDTKGTALSFIKIEDKKRFKKVKETLGSGAEFKPYHFKMEELDSFRYRSRDALRAVTSIAVKEARLKEIKREMLTSEKLKNFFKEHPKDLKVLRSDRDLHTVRHQPHLKDMPDYIIPPTLKGLVQGRTGQRRLNKSDTIDDTQTATVSHTFKRKKSSKNNPLKTFRTSSTSKCKKSKVEYKR